MAKSKKSAECPVCGKLLKIPGTGKLPRHGEFGGGAGRTWYCKGSSRIPSELVEVVREEIGWHVRAAGAERLEWRYHAKKIAELEKRLAALAVESVPTTGYVAAPVGGAS